MPRVYGFSLFPTEPAAFARFAQTGHDRGYHGRGERQVGACRGPGRSGRSQI